MKLLTGLSLAVVATCQVGQADAQTTVEYYHTDALGSVVAVTDASGLVVERNEFEPFGLETTGTHDGPAYTGHAFDAPTGFSYMQQRYFDAGLGRFLSVDPVSPLSSSENFNRYWYANDNPYRFTDPDGRRSKEEADHKREQAVARQARISSIAHRSPGSTAQMVTARTGGGLNINWKAVGRSVEGKVGPGLAAQVGGRLGPFKAKVGPEASFGFQANLAGELAFYGQTDWNLLTVSAGKHSVGLGVLDGGKDTFFRPGQGVGTDVEYYSDRTIGYSRGAASQSNWAIGAEAGIPGGAAEISIDFKQIWDAVNYDP